MPQNGFDSRYPPTPHEKKKYSTYVYTVREMELKFLHNCKEFDRSDSLPFDNESNAIPFDS